LVWQAILHLRRLHIGVVPAGEQSLASYLKIQHEREKDFYKRASITGTPKWKNTTKGCDRHVGHFEFSRIAACI